MLNLSYYFNTKLLIVDWFYISNVQNLNTYYLKIRNFNSRSRLKNIKLKAFKIELLHIETLEII